MIISFSRVFSGLCIGLASILTVSLISCTPPRKAPAKRVVKQCLDCHPEFKQRYIKKNIHAPVKDNNCYACHRPHGLYGKVVFRRQQPQLCFTCHPEVKPESSAASVHAPVAGNTCTVCHNPHNSDYAKLLADETDASCFTCHDRAPFTMQIRHAPLDSGCDTCHVPHSSSQVSLLKISPDNTCGECHDVAEGAFVKAHFSYPVESGCISCHTPHSSDDGKMLKLNVHAPVMQGECDACHALKGKSITTRKTADQLCLDCHDISKSGTSIHEPYVQGQCTACHDVHASNFRVLLATAPEKVCLECHAGDMGLAGNGSEDQPAEKEQKAAGADDKPLSRHDPFVKGECLECHKGHTSDQEFMLQQSVKTLCYECHEQSEYSAGRQSHTLGESGRCDSCHVPHQSKVRRLLGGDAESQLCFTCHTATANERGKYSLHKPFAKGECGQCHQLHRAPVSGFLSKSYVTGEICYTCHEKFDPGMNKFNGHKPVTAGQCSKCHQPHAADNEHVMRLPEGEQCYGCHRAVKQKMGALKVAHKPASEGQCTACHVAHGSPYESILKKNQPALCISCHLDVAQFWLEGYQHKPAVKSCLQCHRSHGSDHAAVLVKPSGQLCSGCHDVKTGAFVDAHQKIRPGLDSCVTCHDSHGSPVKSMLYPVMHSPFKEGSCAPCHSGGKK